MGKVLGGKEPEFPSWFKESFLDLGEDVAEAAEEDKHVLLFFHVANCPYCDKMLEENFKASSYTDFLQERFDSIEINVRGSREVAFNEELTVTEAELARTLKVRYTPTIIFLDSSNKGVLRLNGYRSVQAFKYALDFVNEKAYQKTRLSQYIEDKAKAQVYTFRDHESFSDLTDLSTVADQPLAVVFEDRTCDECDALHDGILALPDTKALLNKFTVVRLDAFSTEPITDVNGKKTTPKGFAADLGITYRPGIVLFDKGKEIVRMDGMLRTFYFQQVLRFVADRHFEEYPSYREFRRADTQAILQSGKDVDIWK